MKKKMTAALAALALAVAAAVVASSTARNVPGTAAKVSARLENRFERLDDLASELLDRYTVSWPDIGNVPDDMILYRYVSDTLNCWYNLFIVKSDDIAPVQFLADSSGVLNPVKSTLSRAGVDPVLVITNHRWYILKKYSSSNRTVIAGLLVKDESKAPGSTGYVNRHLRIPRHIILTTPGNEGYAVNLAGVHILSLQDGPATSSGAIMPFMNADIGLPSPFGLVLLVNLVIFMAALTLHLCRRKIRKAFRVKRSVAVISAVFFFIASAGIIWHCFGTLARIVGNSTIALDPHGITFINWQSICTYISYISLCVAAYLVADLALSLVGEASGRHLTLRRSLPTLVCAALLSVALCLLINRCAFEKEQRRMASISGMLAVDAGSGVTGILPPFFSYARYLNGRLVSFKGNFAYPVVVSSQYADRPIGAAQNTILSDGYRHFINYVNDNEMIVLSREEMSFISFFVMFSFLVICIFLFMYAFHIRGARHAEHTQLFSRRIKRLIILSLVSTLVVMAAVSIVFVYQRNVRSRREAMSTKISSVQVMLDSYCTRRHSYKELSNADFLSKLIHTARTAQGDILLYSPSGRLFMCSSFELMNSPATSVRMDPEAYKKIMLEHQRYCILPQGGSASAAYALFAPVMNADGHTIAIASVPGIERDLDFMRDAVFHATSIISVFLFILFIVIIVVSSITNAVFHPLWEMGKKMLARDFSSLEMIEYNGDDEISILVGAYNSMVQTMRSGTARLAEAERNKAWSEMARQVAHEIKNPLTPIKLELQRIIRLKQKGDPSWEEKFDVASSIILEHIDILSQTANEFSTFAKLYSEPPVEIDLGRMIGDQIVLFEERGVKITYLGLEDAVYSGPKPQLTRVVFNILSNAVQAVEGVGEPKVLVSLRRGDMPSSDSPCWVLTVEDNGAGVSDENLGKLFTPNFTTKSGGTGLGLAICRNVVENCGGTISYSRSFSLGGACFTVCLPTC